MFKFSGDCNQYESTKACGKISVEVKLKSISNFVEFCNTKIVIFKLLSLFEHRFTHERALFQFILLLILKSVFSEYDWVISIYKNLLNFHQN